MYTFGMELNHLRLLPPIIYVLLRFRAVRLGPSILAEPRRSHYRPTNEIEIKTDDTMECNCGLCRSSVESIIYHHRMWKNFSCTRFLLFQRDYFASMYIIWNIYYWLTIIWIPLTVYGAGAVSLKSVYSAWTNEQVCKHLNPLLMTITSSTHYPIIP